jgi:hypothetical protein
MDLRLQSLMNSSQSEYRQNSHRKPGAAIPFDDI